MKAERQLLDRVQREIAEAVRSYHRDRGTTVPDPAGIVARSLHQNYANVEFPVHGSVGTESVSVNVTRDYLDDFNIGRIVERASMWRRWHQRIPEIAAELPAELERLTQGTSVQVVGTAQTRASGTERGITAYHYADVRVLDGSLHHTLERWQIERHENADGKVAWDLRVGKTMLATQRKRSRMLAERDGRPRLTVERTLARRLLEVENRMDAHRRLFKAANGETGTKVPWQSITLLEAREGRIVATIPLSDKARIRDDRITVKGVRLPDTLVSALTGRPVEEAIIHPLLKGRMIRHARSGRQETVIELMRDDVDYETFRQELCGER